ncbi:flagellar basal body L-ring protein FlgH [Opitutales bacterium]|nr:flagellar basal body L-ring protein FlgH [Opitutales bacterium]MDC1005469.1 flagellar basal body L-ring protein FlgH [Opitutales bacterium]
MKFFITFLLLLFVNVSFGVSLWMKSSNNQRGLYGDKRSFSVGDLITIDVGESSSLAASQNSVRNRQSQVENAVKQFLFANSKMGTHNGGLPGTEIESKSSNKGGGSIANTQNLKGRVSVVIIDVLPNGVLVLEGARMVTFSGESYYAVLKGMVRQEDIGAGFREGLRYRNIVSSQYIADAQIEFVSKGSLNDAQKESWYQKIASVVNPF